MNLKLKPILPGIVPIGIQKKHAVSNWSMEDLEALDWLKFLIFVKLFFPKTSGKIRLKNLLHQILSLQSRRFISPHFCTEDIIWLVILMLCPKTGEM